MAYLKTPAPRGDRVTTLRGFLGVIAGWQPEQESTGSDEGFLSQLWYRGATQHFEEQVPGVYRQGFTDRANRLNAKKDGDFEDNRLHLEREMLSQFRTAGAAFLNRNSLVEIYFAAQHFGMPTRLLDWSTNPLAALFFACEDCEKTKDKAGVVYAMDARKIIAPDARITGTERLYPAVMTMRHPFVEYAVGLSFWSEPKKDWYPHVLPVRPDIVPGRVGQQGSCFTLHMHKAKPAVNKTLFTVSIAAGEKGKIRDDLHRLNINQFTTYYDLDHLSKEINRSWGAGELNVRRPLRAVGGEGQRLPMIEHPVTVDGHLVLTSR